jgi:hypothetical protein
MKTTPPPKISAHAQEFFSAVVDRYDLEAHHLVVLRGVVQQMTVAEHAAEILSDQGICCLDRYGIPREHPMVSVERRARAEVRAGIHQLNLQTFEAIATAGGW